MKDAILPISAGAAIIALVLFVAVGKRVHAADAAGITQVSAKEAAALIAKNKGVKTFVILDVRTPAEFAEGHIAGAVNIDYYAPDFKERIAKLDKKNSYLVVCRSGNRSGKSCPLLTANGIANVVNMKGGMMGWEFERLPVERK